MDGSDAGTADFLIARLNHKRLPVDRLCKLEARIGE